MPISIFLRTSKTHSLYRDAIIHSLATGVGTHALICSGFFQENKGTPKGKSIYQASLEPGFIAALKKNKIQLDTIGIHNKAWMPSYINFYNNLKNNGIKITPYIMKKFQWHAKVFLLKHNEEPIFGIIGSSNLTANAFGVSNSPALPTDSPHPPNAFNYECDIYLWSKKYPKLTKEIKKLITNEHTKKQIIIAKYKKQDNYNISIETRLSNIEKEILTSPGIEKIII